MYGERYPGFRGPKSRCLPGNGGRSAGIKGSDYAYATLIFSMVRVCERSYDLVKLILQNRYVTLTLQEQTQQNMQ
ncbi:hypothetical protein PAXY110619_12090 [Paenibacillus xylanexedens]|uniref:Uncharacterized protein n=1 Tax=Paenibacillus xylanexedens TaxID=528191 RepID=A0ABS4RLH5_PAEXY|nr:hypothetical protein [Paenibacillus xylanexedens]